MRHRTKCGKLRISVLGLLISASSIAGDYIPGASVQEAVRVAGLSSTDSTRSRVIKSLNLINDRHYFFSKTSPPKNGYDLDGLRTPDQILNQKVGGGCGSSGLAIAAMLIGSGIPSENIRVIGAVVNSELKQICTTESRPVKKINTPLGLSGHIFISFKDEKGAWYLVNSTSTANPPEIIPYFSPADLEKRSDKPVQIPREAYSSILNNPHVSSVFHSGLTIFDSWRLEEYPKHSFKDRYNLIASGRLSNEVCRYDPKMVDASIKYQNESGNKKSTPTYVPDQTGSSSARKAI